MARIAQLVGPGIADHVAHRSNRREAVFFCDDERWMPYTAHTGAAGDSTSYVYDFSGRLLMSTNPPRKYYYDGINTLLVKELYTGSSSSCWRTITANVLRDAPIGQIVTQMNYGYGTLGCTGTPAMNYIAYHYDHIANVLATTECDGYGTPRDAVDMDAFGNVMEGTQEGVRLTTKHYDPSSQLYYFGARWYDPVAGRWIELDPADTSSHARCKWLMGQAKGLPKIAAWPLIGAAHGACQIGRVLIAGGESVAH